MSRFVFILVVLSTCFWRTDAAGADPALELFQQRIMPIFNSPKPSSCVQCHLASVDLKDYILPSSEQTFLSLRDQQLIDVADPSKSKILTLISMGDRDRDPLAKRIHAKTRQAEYEAFTAWVHACCDDKALVNRPPLTTDVLAKPDPTDDVIRHGRKDRVLDSFVRNVWSQRMRCFPCHTPNEIDPENPQHAKPKQNHRKFVKQYGARMNLFKATPRETMNSLIASSRKKSSKRLPLINLDEPTKSLLVLKPTSKIPPKKEDGTRQPPSSLAPVSHMGGLKMHVDDVSYKAVITWIQDLASVKQGKYATKTDLPADNWYPTKHILRMKELPESWPPGETVQLFVHAASGHGDHWDDQPIAFTQGTITPRRFVNGSLILLRSPSDSHAVAWDSQGATLSPGKYRISAFLDSDHQIETDPSKLLGEDDFQGQMIVTADWKEGFKQAQVISAKELSVPSN
jgi:hypothetical protein